MDDKRVVVKVLKLASQKYWFYLGEKRVSVKVIKPVFEKVVFRRDRIATSIVKVLKVFIRY